MEMPSKSVFRGCVLGQCLGDALGFPMEGHDKDDCNRYMSNFVHRWFHDITPSKTEWAGQYTDDSQLARELLISLVNRKTFDARDYAHRISDIFRTNKVVGRGIATDEAASNLIRGVHWRESGTPAPSAGNGTAMRAGPIGLFYYDDPDKLIDAAHWQGYITHQDPRCSAGSIAIAGAVALALRKGVDDADEFIETISEWMRRYSPEFADIFLRLKEWTSLEPLRAVDPIRKAGKPLDFIADWPGISPFVVGSVLWSIYSFLRNRDSYRDAVSTAISVGGDVDTTGAMTGAISGAWLGIEALPEHLLRRINDKRRWGYGRLISLADKCYRIKCG